MSLFSRWFQPSPPPLSALWQRVSDIARQPRWYLEFGVPDTVDGRFDMVALIGSLVLTELERRGRKVEVALLTERFVDDMDGSLRDIGISDVSMAKEMGRLIGAFGGRLGAYRAAFADDAADAALDDALRRNVFRGEDDPEGDPKGDGDRACRLAAAIRPLAHSLRALADEPLLAGAFA